MRCRLRGPGVQNVTATMVRPVSLLRFWISEGFCYSKIKLVSIYTVPAGKSIRKTVPKMQNEDA